MFNTENKRRRQWRKWKQVYWCVLGKQVLENKARFYCLFCLCGLGPACVLSFCIALPVPCLLIVLPGCLEGTWHLAYEDWNSLSAPQVFDQKPGVTLDTSLLQSQLPHIEQPMVLLAPPSSDCSVLHFCSPCLSPMMGSPGSGVLFPTNCHYQQPCLWTANQSPFFLSRNLTSQYIHSNQPEYML